MVTPEVKFCAFGKGMLVPPRMTAIVDPEVLAAYPLRDIIHHRITFPVFYAEITGVERIVLYF
jgi:hypothetical protein